MFYLKSVHLGEKFKISSGFPSTNFYNTGVCFFFKRSIEKRQNGVWNELVAEQLAAEDGEELIQSTRNQSCSVAHGLQHNSVLTTNWDVRVSSSFPAQCLSPWRWWTRDTGWLGEGPNKSEWEGKKEAGLCLKFPSAAPAPWLANQRARHGWFTSCPGTEVRMIPVLRCMWLVVRLVVQY